MDYEVINAWIDKGFSEELIVAALNETVLSGVNSLRYVDKILYDWQRKGIKKVDDIQKKVSEDKSSLFETSVLNLDWLHEK